MEMVIIAASNRKIVLVIADRLSTNVLNSLKSMVMDQSEVVAKGSHQELVVKRGNSKELVGFEDS